MVSNIVLLQTCSAAPSAASSCVGVLGSNASLVGGRGTGARRRNYEGIHMREVAKLARQCLCREPAPRRCPTVDRAGRYSQRNWNVHQENRPASLWCDSCRG